MTAHVGKNLWGELKGRNGGREWTHLEIETLAASGHGRRVAKHNKFIMARYAGAFNRRANETGLKRLGRLQGRVE